jgi:hypothetical protein
MVTETTVRTVRGKNQESTCGLEARGDGKEFSQKPDNKRNVLSILDRTFRQLGVFTLWICIQVESLIDRRASPLS